MLIDMTFWALTFFPKAKLEKKLIQPECCKAKVSEREISRSQWSKVKVSLQLYWSKGTISTINDLVVLN